MTEDIRLYNLDFELIAIARRVKSSSWELYYNKIGTFEAHVKFDRIYAPVIFDNEYFIAVEGKKQAFVTAAQVNREIVLYGKTLNFLFSKRCVMPFDTTSSGIENNPVTVCNELVKQVFINSRSVTAPDGTTVELPGVSNMIVVDNSSAFETKEDVFAVDSAKALSEVVIERLGGDNLGHELCFDVINKQWIFKIYSGKNRSVILSERNRNFYDTDYTSDIQNVAYAGFFEKPSEAEATETTDKKIYAFIKNTKYDTVKNPICLWETVLTGSEENDAHSTLNTYVKNEKITGTVAHLKFGNDYELGDKLRIQLMNDGFNKTFWRRVTGVKVYRESNEVSVEPILEE